MRNFYTMKNLVKGLMLSAVMTLGVTTASAQATGTGDVKPATSTEFWMGEKATSGDFYLYNVGTSIFATNNTPSEKNIAKATLWTATESKKGFSFKDKKGGYAISMSSILDLGISWTAEITTKGTATSFALINGTTTGKEYAYKLSKKDAKYTRYFNIDTNTKPYYYYSPAEHTSAFNDWLLISDTQKKAYDEYVNLFNEAKSYTEAGSKLFDSNDHTKTDPIVKQLNDALQSYNYNSYEEKNGGKDKLEAAIKAAKDFINSTATGINNVNSASEAKATAIYGVNGARRSQLAKGVNIVKMSDGTVKKVLVK